MRIKANKLSLYFLLILSLVFIFRLCIEPSLKKWGTSKKVEHFQSAIHIAERKLQRYVNTIATESDHQKIKDDNIGVFIYNENDSLTYWSNNRTPIAATFWEGNYSKIAFLRNGWYLTKSKKYKNGNIVGVYKIKNIYPVENKYLKNTINSELSKSNFTISVNPFESNSFAINLNNAGENFEFYIQPIETNAPSIVLLVVFDLLLVLGLIGAIWLILKNYDYSQTITLTTIGIIGAFRVLTIFKEYPQNYYNLQLFDPNFFAAGGWQTSLGDVMINVVLIIISVLIIRKVLAKKALVAANKPLLTLTALIVTSILALFAKEQVSSIVYNSTIPLDIANIYEFNALSFWAFCCITFILGGCFLISDTFINYTGIKLNKPLFFYGSVITIAGLLYYFSNQSILVTTLFIGLTLIVSHKARFFSKNTTQYLLLNCAFLALIGMFILEQSIEKKENENLAFFAEELKSNADLSFEIHTQNYIKDLKNYNNQTLYDYNINDIDIKEYTNYVSQQYFLKYAPKYDIKVFVYDSGKVMFSNVANPEPKQNLTNQIKSSKGTMVPELYLNSHGLSSADYILYFQPPQEALNKLEVYITFTSKSYQNIAGFPVLLQDDPTSHLLKNWSYARYKNGSLISKNGSFNYPFKIQSQQISKELSAVEYSTHAHYILENEGLIAVVSKPKKTISGYLNTFSFLFICLSTLMLIARFPYIYWYLSHSSLGLYTKVQFFVMSFLVFSIVIIAVGTYLQIKTEFNQRNKLLLKDKVRSVQFEVEHKISNKKNVESEKNKEYLEKILTKFSNVFYTDISLYSKSGDLIASSASSLFNKGIVMRKMDSKAFAYTKSKQQAELIQPERIGDLNYLSAYTPIMNNNGEFLAHLNLPYFIKQQDFDKEWGAFLSALLNIYLFLFALFMGGSFLLSGWITKPLKTIREMLENLDIEQENQILSYEGNDEIGAFVTVYNEKVKELSEKTAQLAKTQKEAAWKEMAKQVAHEIKNPLTPMKLSVQYLMQRLQTKNEEEQERLSTFGGRMIEQIEVLTGIANEFSNFAKMPTANFEEVDLIKITKDTVGIYLQTSNQNNINIITQFSEQELVINADKNQVLRVVQNILKNAIQAVKENSDGEITVNIKKEENKVKLFITDNGSGIPENIQEKIFEPNFTTKSSGTGLGLAMSKKIIENHKGEIGFQTSEKGTQFWFWIPL